MSSAASPWSTELVMVPAFTVGPGRIATYTVPLHWITNGRNTSGEKKTRAERKDDPIMAAIRAKKRATDAAGWLFLRSRGRMVRDHRGGETYFRQGFWTFTLPEEAPEEDARAALGLFWNWARKVHGVDEYFWAAELTKRGRVHFHAIVNEWVNIDEVKRAWMRCLATAGCLTGDHCDVKTRREVRPYAKAPLKVVTAERAKSSANCRLYAAKYIGKAFGGKRAEQLQLRLDHEEHQLRLGNVQADTRTRIDELKARLSEAMANVRLGARRWSATQNLNRSAPSVNGFEDERTLVAIRAEMDGLGGKWGKKTEHGQTFYFDLGAVSHRRSPILHRMLQRAAVDERS